MAYNLDTINIYFQLNWWLTSRLLCFEGPIRYELGEAHEFDFVDGTVPCPPNPGKVYHTIDTPPDQFGSSMRSCSWML